jgi:hypothetical protein
MSTPDETPVVVRDRDWHPADWCHAAVRLVLLLALLVGAAAGIAALHPAPASQEALIADLDAHRVRRISYDSVTKEVRWRDGQWRWRKTTLAEWTTVNDQAGDTAYAWLDQQIGNSGSRVSVDQISSANGSNWLLSNRLASGPVQVITSMACLTIFLMMIGRSRHRYANRWAWFWLFTIGQGGVVLYPLMEPQPLWRPRSWARRADRRPIGGGAGFGYAILLSIAVSVLGYFVTTI